ncbi:MAG: YafY family transcriptional regulator [Hahellaceae bacterium]|nr:YafY family transcriptional regulator [Hahellaceae bacterium]MCP5169738.1 YafY family transcriptional regulator [Hahellaceae bacterium]
MRKAERLFQIITLLRGRRTAMTAQQLADVLEISVRTLYRDIQALVLSGVPVEGEAGIGYRLRPGYQLPPLMFDAEEVLALLVGSRMVRAFTDPDLARAALRAESKIRSILPPDLQQKAARQPYRIPVLQRDERARIVHRDLRRACESQRCVQIDYLDQREAATTRVVYPLAIMGWRESWSLLAWCEMRQAYRNFRLDRVHALTLLARSFEVTDTCSLQHYLQTEMQMDDFD